MNALVQNKNIHKVQISYFNADKSLEKFVARFYFRPNRVRFVFHIHVSSSILFSNVNYLRLHLFHCLLHSLSLSLNKCLAGFQIATRPFSLCFCFNLSVIVYLCFSTFVCPCLHYQCLSDCLFAIFLNLLCISTFCLFCLCLFQLQSLCFI